MGDGVGRDKLGGVCRLNPEGLQAVIWNLPSLTV